MMAMPKTPVYEETEAMLRKDDIRRSREILSMESEAETKFMSDPSDAQLWGGILSSDRPH